MTTIPAALASGYELFRRRQFPREAERYRALAAGQRPETMVIACADSLGRTRRVAGVPRGPVGR
jgi:carbonic anhydrase